MHELPQLIIGGPAGVGFTGSTKVNLNLGSRYRALALLAKGGMGAVYLAQQLGADRKEAALVAVKVMHSHIADSPETVNMFIDEARIGTRIDHPNVVRVLDTDVIEDTPFLVMEFIEGLSLSRFLRRLEDDQKPIEVDVIARIMHDALLGLGAAHALEAIHRDVSPQNILIGVDGRSRITDFGVASFSGRLASTNPGEVRGKLGYLAPEQVSRTGVDQRADVFAAGIVLWETLTGKELFATNDKAETLVRVLREPVPPPSAVANVEIPMALEDACLRALERDRDRRFQSATEFANALEKALPLASPAHVGALVEKLGSDILANQRRAVDAARSFLEREDPVAAAALLAQQERPPPSRRALLSASEDRTTQTKVRPNPASPESQREVATIVTKQPSAAKASPLKWALLFVAALALVGIGTLLGRSTTASSQTSPSTLASSSSPSVAVVAPIVSVQEEQAPPSPPTTAAARAAPTLTSTASSAPPPAARGFRRLPPRSRPPTASAAPSPASPPPPTTAPRGTRLPDGTFVPEQL